VTGLTKQIQRIRKLTADLRRYLERKKMFCCDKFAKEVKEYKAPVGGGFLYPTPNPQGQFEQDEDGSWNVNGCCGGGCFVVTGMLFCPFCGAKLPDNQSFKADGEKTATA